VAAEDERRHALHRHPELQGDERAVACGVEHARHPDDPLLREAGHHLRDVGHHVERVRHEDQDRVRRGGAHLLRAGLHDPRVRVLEIVPAHPGLARDPGGDHDDVRPGGVVVRVRPADGGVEAEHRARLEQVESLPLGRSFENVEEHDVAELLRRASHRHVLAHESAADDRDLLAHE